MNFPPPFERPALTHRCSLRLTGISTRSLNGKLILWNLREQPEGIIGIAGNKWIASNVWATLNFSLTITVDSFLSWRFSGVSVVLNLAGVILSASIRVEEFPKSQQLSSPSQHSIRASVSFVPSEVSFGLDLAVATQSKALLCQVTYRLSAALVLAVENLYSSSYISNPRSSCCFLAVFINASFFFFHCSLIENFLT